VQIDDPVLIRYPEEAKRWGIEALEQCFAGIDGITTVVHICRGYPDKNLEARGLAYKAKPEFYKEIFKLLRETNIDQISIEAARGGIDFSTLGETGEKTIHLGVLDVGEEEVETVDKIIERAREALNYLPPERLILSPDCGMVLLTRDIAKRKLRNLVKAAERLNEGPIFTVPNFSQ